jgi:hypothetical protein
LGDRFPDGPRGTIREEEVAEIAVIAAIAVGPAPGGVRSPLRRRGVVHAGKYGEQVLAKILLAFFQD